MADVSTGHSVKSIPIEDVQRSSKSSGSPDFADILGETWASPAKGQDPRKLNPDVGNAASQILKLNPLGPDADSKPAGLDPRIPREVKAPPKDNYRIDDHGFHTGIPAPPKPDQRLDTEHKSPKPDQRLDPEHKSQRRDPVIDEPEPTPGTHPIEKPKQKPDPLQKGPHNPTS
jgi:hypothetical protein